MLEKTKLSFYRFLSVILLVVLLSLSGVMYVSAHGGDVTLIHACVSNRNGAVRIVSPTAACDTNKETALDWGIQGTKGDKGDTGDVGPVGPTGVAGTVIDQSRVYQNVSDMVPVNYGPMTEAHAFCNDDNDVLLSGGYYVDSWDVQIAASSPVMVMGGTQRWDVAAFILTESPGHVQAIVNCLLVD